MKKYSILLFILAVSCSCQKNDPEILVEITDVSNITHSSAIFTADATIITPGMSIFEKGVCISVTPSPVVTEASPVGGINIPGEYITPVSGLTPDTKYYVKAFVKTDRGICYSGEFSFRTLPVSVFIDPRDGQEYCYIEYRDNTWMVSNLNFPIKGSYYFNNDSLTNACDFGRLYSYEAAVAACPPGWQLPDDSDWKLLETELGMDQVATDAEGPRGTDQASQLKEPGNRLWDGYENNRYSTNSSGFTARPSGEYDIKNSRFSDNGKTGMYTVFWSSANTNDVCYVRVIHAHVGSITRSPVGITAKVAYPVRCIKIK